MYKNILYLSYCLFIAKNSQSVHFCETEKDLVYAFIIGNDVYFGVNGELWTFGILSHKISESRSFIQLFGQNLKGVLVTGFKISENMLDLKECEKSLQIENSDNDCVHANKAKDLVIILCYSEFNLYYYSFRYNNITSALIPIATEDDMPWSLPTKGEFHTFAINYFNYSRKSYLKDIYQNIIKSYTLTGLTFIQNDETLLVSVVSDSLTDGRIILIPIKGTSVKKTREFQTKAFSGLFNIFGSVYGMDYNRKIFLLDWFNEQYYTAKQFFKCENNSEPQSKRTTDLTNTTSYDSSVLPSKSTSNPNKSSSKIWILYLFLYAIIAFTGLAIYLFLLKRMATNNKTEESARSDYGAEETESIKSENSDEQTK